ncbi:unnamed protein product [Phytophthora lilii]|uniref:Unnamed protein product n=1 Tax=Phytophthora lilii TaxID=2077276 RepID=A0A9W7CPY2_9STRA|nr:unnamed protein product [Phytophthora lilii]
MTDLTAVSTIVDCTGSNGSCCRLRLLPVRQTLEELQLAPPRAGAYPPATIRLCRRQATQVEQQQRRHCTVDAYGAGVFQCPDVAGPAEAKELYEATTGKKVLKPVLAVAQPKNATPRSTTTISCVVMDTLETEITPDSAAEVSMVTTKLLNQLVAEGTWIKHQEMSEKLKPLVLEKKAVQVKSKVQMK